MNCEGQKNYRNWKKKLQDFYSTSSESFVRDILQNRLNARFLSQIELT